MKSSYLQIFLVLALFVVGGLLLFDTQSAETPFTTAEGQDANMSSSSGSASSACALGSDVDQRFCQRDHSSIDTSTDCSALTIADLRDECVWHRAIVTMDASQCESLSGDRRDICIWDVNVATYARFGRQDADFSLCDSVVDVEIRTGCQQRSYAMEWPTE